MLEFSWRNVSSDILGSEHGINVQEEFNNYSEKIGQIITDLYARKSNPGELLGWMDLAYNEETIWYVKEYAAQVRGKFDNILVLGIGGSALGSKAIAEALLKPYWNILTPEERDGFPRLFFIDNIDPDQINGLLNALDLKKTLVNVITKSGSTAETMSAYMIVKEKMEKLLGAEYRKNFVAITDAYTGVLRQLSEQEGYKAFVIPENVGGRFSIFSPVGLVPLALLGIDIDELLGGVRAMDEHCKNPNIHENIAAQNALIHYLLDKKGKNITVMMPYSGKLRYISDWFVELWAESLGKEYDLDGNVVHTGQTPVRAVGATDQHSQIQLYNEGPNDKIINFIRVKEFDTELKIPHIFEYTGIGYLCDKTINNLINAEADATRVALTDYRRPNVTITMPKVNAYYIGQLMYMLEMQTAIAGGLYNINAFDQPGVEQAKNYTYALMGRIGYEESARELREKMDAATV